MKNFGLSKTERIKKAKDFKKIYLDGKVIVSEDGRFKATFLTSAYQGKNTIKVAPVVSKKAGIAVWRNRIKRLIRESYRLQKADLVELCKEKNITLDIVFSPIGFSRIKNKKIILSEIMPEILDLLIKIKKIIKNE